MEATFPSGGSQEMTQQGRGVKTDSWEYQWAVLVVDFPFIQPNLL